MIFNRRIQEFIAIDGRDDPLFHESLPSKVIRSIAYGR